MDLQTQFRIRSNFYLMRYLQEHSYWYKYLNRNPESIAMMEQEAKEVYRLTTKDKMEDLGTKIEMIRNFMEILN